MTNQRSASPQHHAPVTVIGLGPMGLALAETLLEHGHPTTDWNRTPEKADSLVTKGVHRAGTVAEAVSASPVTIMCLKDYETMYAVLDSAGDALKGRALVNLNSGTPNEAHAAVSWATERGEDVFDKHRATLAGMGAPRFHTTLRRTTDRANAA
ncbi:NAD(P)-binding domain-containing protein [Streptomyces sp. NPDC056296]|uniref:NAD(P)-binding domain-containing protein n=1 Tax=Streptomyces sp. NPDC056296 TaxID=3345775 RepID=UPI0035E2D678